jgi:hypothetical protein
MLFQTFYSITGKFVWIHMLSDPKQLTPIVNKVIRTLYGTKVRNLTIRIAERFTMKPDFWDVAVDFKDSTNQYTVDLEINANDGKVVSAREIIKWKLR